MKITTLILIAIALTLSINAQWYATQYGVTNMNELSKTQLELAMHQGTNLKTAGVAITVITGAMLLVGTVMYSNGLSDITTSNSYSQIDQGVTKGATGALLMYTGSLGMCVGVPVWIVGAQRVNVVNVHLVKFDQMGYGVGLSLSF